jgi:hypothetical protein
MVWWSCSAGCLGFLHHMGMLPVHWNILGVPIGLAFALLAPCYIQVLELLTRIITPPLLLYSFFRVGATF